MFEKPELKLVKFDLRDIISASNETTPTEATEAPVPTEETEPACTGNVLPWGPA